MKNAYPEKPVLLYRRTQILMSEVISYIKGLPVPVEVKRAAYVFFRIESANGNSGINNNYTGSQCDGARWPAQYDSSVAGTVVKTENVTGKIRRFIAFNTWKDSVNFTVSNLERRGMYITGKTWRYTSMEVRNVADLCTAYKREWVAGNAGYEPTKKELNDFKSMYTKACTLFT